MSRLTAVSACFVLSGLGSLVLEIAWTRQLRLVFGSTTLAASTILVSYMLGLGCGALAGGRLARRVRDGVRAYGALEVGIGLYALAVPTILAWFPLLNRTLLYRVSFWPAALSRFALSVAVLAPPTLLMGASLPVLVGAIVHGRERAGRRIALLYGLNTLGAVGGGLLAAFVFFPRLGPTATSAAAGIAALGAASLASTLLLAKLPQLFVDAVASLGTSPGLLVTLEFALGILVMLPSTLILGALFPLVTGALAVDRGTAEPAVGD